MSATDFIFGGQSPPNSAPTGGNRNVPQFMSDATMNYVNQVAAVAQDPYQSYSGPRLAAPSGQEQQGWSDVAANQGTYTNPVQGALGQTQGVAATASPYFRQGAADIARGTGTYTGANVSNYMNPYETNVINQGTNLAMQNFRNNIMPALNSEFIGSGQYGSLGHEGQADLAANQLTQNIQQQDQAALAGAYTSGQQAFNADQARALQGGSELGQLGTGQGYLDTSAAEGTGQLANTGQNLALGEAQAQNTAGQQQTGYNQAGLNLRYQDFLDQTNYDKNQLNWEGAALSGAPQQSSSYSGVMPGYYQNPSPVGSGAGVAGYSSLYSNGGYYAKGGAVEPDGDEIPAWLKEAMKELMRSHRRGALSAAA